MNSDKEGFLKAEKLKQSESIKMERDRLQQRIQEFEV